MQRKIVRASITRLANQLLELKIDYSSDNVRHINRRLTTSLNYMKTLDNEIHFLMLDPDYDVDIVECVEHTDKVKLAIFKAETVLICRLLQSAGNISKNLGVSGLNNSASESKTSTIGLPMIKLEPFRVDI
ncbi:unnamed protein product [Larinioides sclopetarius]|uniref:Uncharacterized protein n=1 Tax=Larinioides sclopetarius TaxID=280406 RepID=A0AAV2AB84_9ARAC